jgi:hypothetical protein
LYLTHYSRVRNLDRLALQMHAGIDAYVAIAEKHEHDDNRQQALRESLFEYYVEQLEEHGHDGDRDQVASVMGIDVELNAQGLEVWLERRKR